MVKDYKKKIKKKNEAAVNMLPHQKIWNKYRTKIIS